MTYKDDIYNEFIEKGIFVYEKQKSTIMLEEGYYISYELVDFLNFGDSIKTFSTSTSGFASKVGKTYQSVRKNVIRRHYLFCHKGYYKTKELNKYLLKNR